MAEYIFANLTSREVTNSTGTSLTFNWVAGQTVSYALRFLERSQTGKIEEVSLDLLNFRAAVGYNNRPPESGTYQIKIGRGSTSIHNTTRELDWNASPFEVEDALNALADRPNNFACDQGEGSIEISCVDGQPVDLEVVPHNLSPVSFGKIQGGQKFKEVKSFVDIGGIRYEGRLFGDQGNDVSIEYKSVVGAETATVLGRGILVEVSGLTEERHVIAAINANPAARALVSMRLLDLPTGAPGNGLSRVTSQPKVYLSGGINASLHKYSLQLVQAPVVFTDWTELSLPQAPVVTVIQEGYTDGSGMMRYPTIMSLYVPPDFRGAYQFERTVKSKRSELVSVEDGISKLQLVLSAFMKDEGAVITVTNPNNNVAHIVFGGELTGINVAALEVFVFASPPADYMFSLDLGNADLAEMLASNEKVALAFEAEGTVWIDRANTSLGTKTIKFWQSTVNIKRPVLWDSLAVRPPINWQRNISPVDYMPYDKAQVYTGQQSAYVAVVGDGLAKQFSVTHELGGAGGVVAVSIKEAGLFGRLIRDSEYELRFNSVDVLSITFNDAPGFQGVVITIVGYGSPSVFNPHTHTIDQIKKYTANGVLAEDLRAILDSLLKRVTRLESLIPRGSITVPSGLESVKTAVPNVGEILPEAEGDAGQMSITSQLIVDAKQPSKPPEPIVGTELALKNKELLAEVAVLKAKATAEAEAAAEVAKLAAVEEKAKIVQEAKQKQTNVISRIGIDQFGAMESVVITSKEITDVIDGSVRVSSPPKIQLTAPSFYPAIRNGKLPWLLPAIHSALPINVSSAPDLASANSKVYCNTSGAGLVLPGGGGRKGQIVPVGEYFGGDGRCLYRLRQSITQSASGPSNTTSYYPIEMERGLIKVSLKDFQFPLATELVLPWQLALAFDSGSMEVGASYVMETKLFPMVPAVTPSPTGNNLGTVGAGVLLGSSLIAFSYKTSETRQFTLSLTRDASGINGTYTDYGVASAVPVSVVGDFLMTVRLVNFDVDDLSPNPVGRLGIMMPTTQLTVTQTI